LQGKAKRLARINGVLHRHLPQKTHRPNSQVTDSFINSKSDRRLIKHSTFVNKIKKSQPPTSLPLKRQRHRSNKKLAANLESLVDALPDVKVGDRENEGKMRHKSLGSRPGALKRKEKVVKGEMERFGESMARLVGAGQGKSQGKRSGETDVDRMEEPKKVQATSTESRWAALRGYISMTMEQNPAFLGKEQAK
jgi:hypothetical protein